MLRLIAILPVIICCLAGCGREEEAEIQINATETAGESSDAGVASEARKQEFTAEELMRTGLDGYPAGTTVHQSTYENGTPLAEGYLNDDAPIGPWRYWHPNGMLAISAEFVYGGKPHGPWSQWYADGRRAAAGNFHYGKPVGDWSFWWPNGRLAMKGPYDDGDKHGLWTQYHPGGTYSSRGAFLGGDRAGLWQFWDESAQPLSPVGYLRPVSAAAN